MIGFACILARAAQFCPVMPLKGGIKQRIARAQKATTVSTEKCDDIVRRNFKKGKWSAPDVVELSDAVASIVPNACPRSKHWMDVPYAKRSSTSGSNASHTIDQSDQRMFLIHLSCRKGRCRLVLQCQTSIIHRASLYTDATGEVRRGLTTTMIQYTGPSTWSAGGYIKETQPTKSVATVTMQNEIPQTLPKMVRSNNMHCHE